MGHNMTYVEKIIDITTGEETIRPYTKEENATVEAAKSQSENEIAEREAQAKAKEVARQAVLDKLGLSADEVAALLG